MTYPPEIKPFLRTFEAAKTFNISRSTLYKWINAKVIKSVRHNDVILIPSSEVNRILRQAK